MNKDTSANHPDAKSILNLYGVIGYRVGLLDEPSTPYDPVAWAIANPDCTSDFFAGFADNASFGLTYAGRGERNGDSDGLN